MISTIVSTQDILRAHPHWGYGLTVRHPWQIIFFDRFSPRLPVFSMFSTYVREIVCTNMMSSLIITQLKQVITVKVISKNNLYCRGCRKVISRGCAPLRTKPTWIGRREKIRKIGPLTGGASNPQLLQYRFHSNYFARGLWAFYGLFEKKSISPTHP